MYVILQLYLVKIILGQGEWSSRVQDYSSLHMIFLSHNLSVFGSTKNDHFISAREEMQSYFTTAV